MIYTSISTNAGPFWRHIRPHPWPPVQNHPVNWGTISSIKSQLSLLFQSWSTSISARGRDKLYIPKNLPEELLSSNRRWTPTKTHAFHSIFNQHLYLHKWTATSSEVATYYKCQAASIVHISLSFGLQFAFHFYFDNRARWILWESPNWRLHNTRASCEHHKSKSSVE